MTRLPTQILIVDDHPVVRRGLVELIKQHPDLAVCGEYDGVAEALNFIRQNKPDLVLVDISLREGHGLDLIKDLNAGKDPPRMLVMSMYEEASYAERALRAGAHGYVPKSDAAESVIDAIRHVMRGEVYLNKHMANLLLRGIVSSSGRPGGRPEETLTDRELQVFEMLGQGLRSREIANRLSLSVKTIDTYREHIKAKLGLASANELMLRAVLWTQDRERDPAPTN